MKKINKKKLSVYILIIAVLLVSYLIYTRPVTVKQLHPMLTLDKCTEISGYYEVGMQAKMTPFTVERNSEEFDELCDLLFEGTYRRKLTDLLPRGTKMRRVEDDDFRWYANFTFMDIEFPSGDTGSGAMLGFSYWLGDLDIFFDGETHAYRTSDQDAWAQEVLSLIQ